MGEFVRINRISKICRVTCMYVKGVEVKEEETYKVVIDKVDYIIRRVVRYSVENGYDVMIDVEVI